MTQAVMYGAAAGAIGSLIAYMVGRKK
jgi:hypothetical protein